MPNFKCAYLCVFTKIFHHTKVIFTRRVNFIQKGFFTKLKYRFTDKIIVISSAIQKTVSDFTGRKDIEIISSIVVNKEPDRARAEKILAGININQNIL